MVSRWLDYATTNPCCPLPDTRNANGGVLARLAELELVVASPHTG